MTPVTLFVPPPGVEPLPLVCDSPHSGTDYPLDFDHAVDRAALRKSEDTHVDTLWSGVPAAGGSLVCATFPRSYIDPNRRESDVDASMLDGAWPGPINPSAFSTQMGSGVAWRLTPERLPIYSRLLSPRELADRIEHYWRPYCQALDAQLRQAVERFGAYWHLNLHSMPSNAYERLGRPPRPLADVALGDLDGSTCSPEFLEVVAGAFKSRGYSVSVNDPYKGQHLIRASGHPAERRQSLQIEFNRALYMDENSRERSAGFAGLKADVDAVLSDVRIHVRGQLGLESSQRVLPRRAD
jgi:N-formylglutamate deformylase